MQCSEAPEAMCLKRGDIGSWIGHWSDSWRVMNMDYVHHGSLRNHTEAFLCICWSGTLFVHHSSL